METITQETSVTGLGGISSTLLKGGRSLEMVRGSHALGGGDVPSTSNFTSKKVLLRDPPSSEKMLPFRSSLGYSFGKDLDYQVDDSGDMELHEVHMNPLTPSDGDSGEIF